MSELTLFGGKKRKRAEGIQNPSSEGGEKTWQNRESESTYYREQKSFDTIGLCSPLLKTVKAMGIKEPTPIQSRAIPAILAGKDVIGSAQTGSGKTAAFALPILHKLSEDPWGVYAIVLTPSRELAYQIGEQFSAFGSAFGARIVTITGGMDMVSQGGELSKQPHVVVATPGRLAHHISTGVVSPNIFARCAFLVLDECDRLSDASFGPDLATIIDVLPKRQPGNPMNMRVLMFSATLAVSAKDAIPELGIGTANGDVAIIDTNKKGSDDGVNPLLAPLTVPSLVQEYLFVPQAVKNAYLYHLLLQLGPKNLTVDEAPTKTSELKSKIVKAASISELSEAAEEEETPQARSIIIFVSRCRSAALVSELLIELGIPNSTLHSVMPQKERIASLAKFKGSIVQVLVATDVASRGLDIPHVDLVINFDVPRLPSDYVHRVGRTARAGRKGRAITFVTQYEVANLQAIEEKVLGGKKLDAVLDQIVPEKEVLSKLVKIATAFQLAQSRLSESGFEDALEKAKARKREGRVRAAEFSATRSR